MKKDLKAPQLVRKISVRDTLLNLKIGDKPTLMPTRLIREGTIRTAANRLKKDGIANFEVSAEGLVNEVKITRLKLDATTK